MNTQDRTRPIIDEDICQKCGGTIIRDVHPDGQAIGMWECTQCDWYQEDVTSSESEDLPW